MSARPLPPELIDAFRAELRIAAVMGLVAGALLEVVGVLSSVGTLLMSMIMGLGGLLSLVPALAALIGGAMAVRGGRGILAGLKPAGIGAQRSLSVATAGLMLAGAPAVVHGVWVLKNWTAVMEMTEPIHFGLFAIAATPMALAMAAGLLGMRIRIALRGFATPSS